ncbi:MAG TPA: hypothetical protein VMJ10_05095 [Kofleriaceae bacterium]|nr:hypothetical protein [Kofleriaceae bacterium]
MVDRQDIDALLVGALYGELTPAEEARLQAHLESHPADRSALDDLKSARQAVRESRVFDLQSEPPQAVSALLLQEAHRRAPRRAAVVEGDTRESWLARLMRSFIVHPAMAAAATLVLVIGVAGGLYLRKGGDDLSRRHNDEKMAETAAGPAVPAPPAVADEGNQSKGKDQWGADNGAAAGSGAAVTGVAADPSGDAYKVGLEDDRKDLAKAETTTTKAALASPKPASHAHDAIVVQRPEPQPKDLDRDRAKFKNDDDESRERGAIGGTGGGAGGHSSGLAYEGPTATAAAPGAPPPPPQQAAPMASPAPAPTHVATRPAPPRKPAAVDAEEDAPAKEAPKAPEDVRWAADQFNQAKVAAGNNDCDTTATKVNAIKDRAPGYYNTNVADDRTVSHCMPLARSLAEKRAVAKKATAAKAKAAPANAADEAPAQASPPRATSTTK